MIKKILALTTTALLALGLTACNGVELKDITIPEDMKNISIVEGETIKPDVSFMVNNNKADREAIEKAITEAGLVWSSENEAIAMVDNTGLITAISVGKTSISVADSKDITKLTINIEVLAEPVTLDVSETINITLDGKTEATAQIEAKLNAKDPTQYVISYVTSDETIATVDNNGLITAKSEGDVIIKIVASKGYDAVTKDVVVSVTKEGVKSEAQKVADKAVETNKNTTDGKETTKDGKVIPKPEAGPAPKPPVSETEISSPSTPTPTPPAPTPAPPVETRPELPPNHVYDPNPAPTPPGQDNASGGIMLEPSDPSKGGQTGGD